jgi:hypothetical protein
MQVRFTVEPVSMYISGVPKTVVVGSGEGKQDETHIESNQEWIMRRVNRKFTMSVTLSRTIKLSALKSLAQNFPPLCEGKGKGKGPPKFSKVLIFLRGPNFNY